MADKVSTVDEKLDDVIVCLTRIETRCLTCSDEIKRHRIALDGQDGNPGLTGRMYNYEKQLAAMYRLRWWWMGICGTMGVALVLLAADIVLRCD